MAYANGASFRRALEDRLRSQSLQTGASLVRLRKMVTFDRFLARLVHDQPGAWVLKGGLALQLRLGDRARTTKDIDVLLVTPYEDIHQALVHAALLDLGDWFRFEVERPLSEGIIQPAGGTRFRVQGLLDQRSFETFHVDVGQGDPLVEPVETLSGPALLAFAGIPPTEIPSYPLSQQIAEKVHAYTRPHASGEGSRTKDLVDILLIAELGPIEARVLAQAIRATFDARRTHGLPPRLPDPPSAWAAPFRRLAEETGLGYQTLSDAAKASHRFLDPILQGETSGVWDPVTWSWQSR